MENDFRQVTKKLDAIYSEQKSFLKYVQQQQQNADVAKKKQEAAAADAAAYQLKINAAQAGVYLVSTVIGFANPKLGKQIGAVGQASIQVFQTLNQYLPVITKLAKGGETLGAALSSVVMTGNIVAAVMNLVPLFVDLGPSPDQVILEQVGQLRNQINDLGQAMEARFNHVDAELGEIYSRLNDGFAAIAQNLGDISAGVTTLRSGQVQLDQSLYQFESSLYQVIADQAGREIWKEIDASIGYKTTTGQDMSFAQYFEHSSFFYTWATSSAFDTVATRPSSAAFGAADLQRELSYPLDRNLNYLADLADAWRVPSIRPTGGKLPNPEQWSLAALAYAQIAAEWPAYAAKVQTARTQQIAAVGTLIQQTQQAVAHNRELFDHAFALYASDIKPLGDWVKSKRNAFVTAAGVNPFGPVDQTPTRVPTLQLPSTSMPPCDPGTDPLPLAAPNGDAVVRILPPDYQTDLRLRELGSADQLPLDVCFSTSWTNVVGLRNSKTGTVTLEGRPTITIVARSNGTVLRGMSRALPTPVPCEPDCKLPAVEDTDDQGETIHPPTTRMRTWWNASGRSTFEGSPAGNTVSPETDAAAAAIRPDVSARLQNEQRTLYLTLARQAGQAPPDDAPNISSGEKSAIVAFLRVGFPRAMAGDEYLRMLTLGDQSLLDVSSLQSLLTGAAAPTAPLPDQDLTAQIVGIARERLGALQEAVRTYQDDVTAGTWVEGHALVDNALARLDLADRIARTSSRPSLVVTALPRQQLRTLLKRGLGASVSCTGGCRATVTLALDHPTAHRLGLAATASGGSVIVASSATHSVPGSTVVVMRLTFTGAARARLASARSVPAVLTVRASGFKATTAAYTLRR
jgi:hypothetical protein